MSEPMSIDLRTPAGFAERTRHAAEDIYRQYAAGGDVWNLMAGRTLDDIAAQLAGDLLQESISLPRSAFADPQAAGREMAVTRNVVVFVYRRQLDAFVLNRLATGRPLPSGRTAPANVSSASQQHRQKSQK